MLSNLLRGCAMAAFLLTATVVSAAEPVKEANQFRAKQILGTKILIQGNKTSIGTVDDIVVQEACGVDVFAHARYWVGVRAVVTDDFAHEQEQGGPNPFAAGGEDVPDDLIGRVVGREQILDEQRLERGEFLGDRSQKTLHRVRIFLRAARAWRRRNRTCP